MEPVESRLWLIEKLAPGVRFEFPFWAHPPFRSRNAVEFPETPLVVLIRRRSDGAFEPISRREVKAGMKGMHLFVPEGVKSGDVLEVQWVEKRSACARVVHAEEITAA